MEPDAISDQLEEPAGVTRVDQPLRLGGQVIGARLHRRLNLAIHVEDGPHRAHPAVGIDTGVGNRWRPVVPIARNHSGASSSLESSPIHEAIAHVGRARTGVRCSAAEAHSVAD
jgi:hypothetical protein